MPKRLFDAESFFDALDDVRETKGLTWKEVADESDVSASTLTRMAQGKRPDVDSLAALVKWSGLSADDYLIAKPRSGAKIRSPLATIAAQFRHDPKLPADGKKAIEATLKAMYKHYSHRED